MKRLCVVILLGILTAAAGIVLFILSNTDTDSGMGFKKPSQEADAKVMVSFPFASPSELNEWQEKNLASKRTDYTLYKKDGKNCVKAVSNDSASTLYYRRQFSSENDPYVSWDWKVTRFPKRKLKEVLNKKAEFDFAAQVYVVFHARFFLNAKAIQYVWTENIPVGEISNSPYTDNVKIVVLECGPSEEWKHEYRDIKKDFKALFGKELNMDIEGISFMTDADSTGTLAEAYFTDFEIGFLSSQSTGNSSDSEGEKNGAGIWHQKIPFINILMENILRLVAKAKSFFPEIF